MTASSMLALLLVGCGPSRVWYGHSADRRHLVEVLEQGGDQWVRLDGEDQRAFEAIAVDALAVGPSGRPLVYGVQQDGRWRLVSDGRIGPPHAGIGELVLSADGRHEAYAVEDGDGWRVVHDGQRGPRFDAILERSLRFSPDGRHLAYVAERSGHHHVIHDGAERQGFVGEGFEGISALRFGPDGRLVHVGRRGRRFWVVVEGDARGPYDGIGEVVVGRDREAFAALVDDRWVAVVDGKTSPAQRRVDDLRIADDDTVAYVVTTSHGDQRVVVVEPTARGGQALDGHAAVVRDSLRLTPGGTLAYVAVSQAGEARMVLRRGGGGATEPGPIFDVLRPAILAGTRWGYVARRQRRWHAVIDGRIGPGYEWAGDLVFTRDGARFAHLARHAGWDLVVHDRGRHAVPRAVAGSLAFDAAGRHLGCLVAVPEVRRFYLTVDGQVAAPFDLGEVAAAAVTLGPSLAEDRDLVRRWVAAELDRRALEGG
ncbi:MAG: hypothetical protein R3B72_48530 [Polyangiaceae bacterium]